jgi:coenzyme PQQ synthesis protein D (PqqD)
MHSLNAVGTVVWEAADGATPLSRIVARVAADFRAPVEVVERDVTEFILHLATRCLLSLGEAPRHDPLPSPHREVAALGYEAPCVLSEGIFETTALACGKLPGGGAKCNSRPKAS